MSEVDVTANAGVRSAGMDDEPRLEMNTEVEGQISQWRRYVSAHPTVAGADVEELEDHLRAQIDDLRSVGLDDSEAFLVAVKRMGRMDDMWREFASEHSDRLWKQLVLPSGHASTSAGDRRGLMAAIATAVAAALAASALVNGIGTDFGSDPEGLIPRNIVLVIMAFVAVFLVIKRQLTGWPVAATAAAFVASFAATNLYPFSFVDGHTAALTAIHLPIMLWFAIGLLYVEGNWRDHAKRMDFIRFTGEVFVYYTLMALGGGVLLGVTAGVFAAIGLDPESFVAQVLLPGGAAAAAIIAVWLVEIKQGAIENIAPVLTRVFTPLFALIFIGFLVTVAVTGRGVDNDPDVLILFDLILVVVLGLHLYSLSARQPGDEPGLFDYMQLALVVSALLIDMLVMFGILGRISEFGFSANKTAALGENLVLLVNLAVAAFLSLGFVRHARSAMDVERWQTSYTPVYPVWAAVVAFVFPVVFDFV